MLGMFFSIRFILNRFIKTVYTHLKNRKIKRAHIDSTLKGHKLF